MTIRRDGDCSRYMSLCKDEWHIVQYLFEIEDALTLSPIHQILLLFHIYIISCVTITLWTENHYTQSLETLNY